MNTIINFLYYSIRSATPLLLGTTGETITEKSGSLNLGVEGMMAVGAIIGYYFGCMTDSFIVALLASFLSAALCGAVFAFLTVSMQANQNVTGLALTTFGLGIYNFIGKSLTETGFPNLDDNKNLSSVCHSAGIPFLRDIPYIGRIFFAHNIFVYIAILISIIAWVYMMKTKKGLRMRSVGENPGAADACGVKVTLYKYVHIIIGGGICGVGGLYLALITNNGSWNEGWINGMGWVSVALVIFANWSPLKAIFGAFFFGMLNTLQPWKGNLADEFPKLLGWLKGIPDDFYQMLPFLITAVIIIITSMNKTKKTGEPQAIGINYFREER